MKVIRIAYEIRVELDRKIRFLFRVRQYREALRIVTRMDLLPLPVLLLYSDSGKSQRKRPISTV